MESYCVFISAESLEDDISLLEVVDGVSKIT